MSFYYRMRISDATLARINERIRQAAEGLVSSDVWDELGQAGTERLLPLNSLIHSSSTRRLSTRCQTCFTRQRRDSGGSWTGKPGRGRGQPRPGGPVRPLCKQKARRCRRADRSETGYLSLQTSQELTFTPADLEKVEGTARASMEEMRRLLLDPVRNVPRPKEAFALTDERVFAPGATFLSSARRS